MSDFVDTQEAPVAPDDPSDGFGPTSDNGTSAAQEALAVRWKLVRAGYTPNPCFGKIPPLKSWETLQGVTHEQLEMWKLTWPDAANTGVLTRTVPAFDVDIRNEEAALAVEDMVREHYEEVGRLLMRIGLPPKRAFLFRTDTPFAKMVIKFEAREGDTEQQRLEFLGDGQQVVVAGIHPVTRKPYSWFGGEPGEIARKDLPLITEDKARELIERAADLLVAEHGYVRAGGLRQQRSRKTASEETPAPATESFFKSVNQLALVNISKWAPPLFGDKLKFYQSSGAYRITSKDLGRDLEEDLSISQLGVRDFGTERGCTPINLVVEYGSQKSSIAPTTPSDAAFWLCERMGVPPVHLGWDGGGAKTGDSQSTKQNSGTPVRLIKSSAEFVHDFTPPDYLLDGILQKRFIYSMTGKTGSGKTAILLRLAASTALGSAIGKHEVEKGRVLYFAGENPDDVRMRWIALAPHAGFEVETVPVSFIPGTLRISEMAQRITAEATEGGPLSLVIIDTSAAYYEGDDVNNNVQQGHHARRLRALTELPGRPCVVVGCHPVKNAAPDNLLPMGGSAFLNEVDGNLTAVNADGAVDLHWQGKFRGPDFAPLAFALRTVTHQDLKDSRGRTIPTVIASYLTEAAKEEIAALVRHDENELLAMLEGHGSASMAALAKQLGWKLRNEEPNKMRVLRTRNKLARAKLITVERDQSTLTDKGKKVLADGVTKRGGSSGGNGHA